MGPPRDFDPVTMLVTAKYQVHEPQVQEKLPKIVLEKAFSNSQQGNNPWGGQGELRNKSRPQTPAVWKGHSFP